MAVNTLKKTHPWPLFSWNGTLCPRSFFTRLWNYRDTCFCEHGKWAEMAKTVYAPRRPPGKMDSCSLQPARKTPWHFFSLHDNNFGQIFELSETCCLLLLVGSHLTVQFHLIGYKNYGSQHSQNHLPWPLFSWNGTVCPRCIYTQHWNCREASFVNLGTGTWW